MPTTDQNVATSPDHFVRMHVHGDAHAPTVLLVHGYTGSSDDWDPVVAHLTPAYRVVTYDHRGHGDSSHYAEPGSYSFDRLRDDLETVVTELDAGPVHLLGHSMGGVVAMKFVLTNPSMVRSLILMDTAAEPSGMPVDLILQLAEIGRAEGMETLFGHIETFLGSVPGDAVVARRFARMDAEAFAAFGAELGSYPPLLADLANVTCPTTVIVGADDTGLRTASDALAAVIPGAHLAVIDDAGHSPQRDQPSEWSAAVLAHLSRAAA